MVLTGFADILAERMRAEHTALAARWFERLRMLVPVEDGEVFPSERLLDHIPALIVDISAYLRVPDEEAIAANTSVAAKARELGTLRHEQRASLHQLLREYQLLGAVLVTFVHEEVERLGLAPSAGECVAVVSRLHESVAALMQETVETFVGLYTATITEQTKRLEQFTRMATHEWRQPLGSLQFALTLMRNWSVGSDRLHHTLEVAERNVAHLIDMTRTLERIARINAADNPIVQEVSATTVAHEAARQLREMAQARDVVVRIADDLPMLTVDVGRLELALVNLLANAIKYSDPQKSERVVELTGSLDDAIVVLSVTDNGIGIPADRIDSIFDRFTRAHPDQENIAGVGLGLSIVIDCIDTLGGRITVESTEGVGTRFVLTLPNRPPLTA
jgi:signal transduction histidine kinase